MTSHVRTDRVRHLGAVLMALPLIVVGFFWAMLALLGVVGTASDPSTALWAIALWGAAGFVALALVARVVLIAGLLLLTVFRGLRRAGC